MRVWGSPRSRWIIRICVGLAAMEHRAAAEVVDVPAEEQEAPPRRFVEEIDADSADAAPDSEPVEIPVNGQEIGATAPVTGEENTELRDRETTPVVARSLPGSPPQDPADPGDRPLGAPTENDGNTRTGVATLEGGRTAELSPDLSGPATMNEAMARRLWRSRGLPADFDREAYAQKIQRLGGIHPLGAALLAVQDLKEGNHANLAMDVVGMVPGVGPASRLLMPLRANRGAGAAESVASAASVQKPLEGTILAAVPELQSRVLASGLSLDSNICRGASGTMQSLLQARGVATEAVANGFHTFLRVPDYFARGQPLYVDPTIRQFVPAAMRSRVPEVFVGSASNLTRTLENAGVPRQVVTDYLRNLRPDLTVPVITP